MFTPPFLPPSLHTPPFFPLLGFLNGLCSSEMPECFRRGVSGPLRPNVQQHYTSPYPYSPLALVIPRGMAPPWKECFVDGQRDILHGGTLSKTLVQGAQLKQCSRYRAGQRTCVGVVVRCMHVHLENLTVSSCDNYNRTSRATTSRATTTRTTTTRATTTEQQPEQQQPEQQQPEQ